MVAVSQSQVVRAVVGCGGIGLLVYGLAGVRAGAGRGAAAAIVIGAVMLYWAWTGRVPSWLRR
ncbi:MAG: hypothetical protein ACREMA_03080 [Longimicrobiales bacterium]